MGGLTRKFGFINWVDNVSWSPFLRLFSKADISRWSRSSVFMVVQGFFFHPSYVSKKDYFDGVFKQNGRRLPMQANHHFAKAYPQCELLNKSNSFCSRSFRIREPHNKESLLEIRKFPHTDGFFSLLRWRLLKICETILSLVCCRFWQKTDASCSSWFMCILYGRWRVFSLLKYWSLSLTLMVQAVKSVNSSTGGHSSFPRVRKPIWLSISLYRFTFL